jgi:hypothetical protein
MPGLLAPPPPAKGIRCKGGGSVRFGEEKDFLLLSGIRTPARAARTSSSCLLGYVYMCSTGVLISP